MSAGSPKSPNSFTSTFFNRVNFLPKDLRFEHGGAKFAYCPGRHLTSLRPCFTGKKKIIYYAGLTESIDNITGERQGKFLKRGRKDPKIGRTAGTFKFFDECSFPKRDIAKILPFPEVTGTIKEICIFSGLKKSDKFT